MITRIHLKTYAHFIRALANTSVCKRRGVACIVVARFEPRIVGYGVNGPAGHNPDLCTGQKDGCGCLHSELNTILNCRPSSNERDVGCVMIATRAPCVPCASAIVNCSFIRSFYYLDESEPGPKGLELLEDFSIKTERIIFEHEDMDITIEKALRDTAGS